MTTNLSVAVLLVACSFYRNAIPTSHTDALDSVKELVPTFPESVMYYDVVGRANVSVTTSERKIGVWQITTDAKTRDQWAQTGIQAAIDLYEQFDIDYIGVILAPNEKLAHTGPYYAQVSYAADGKGSLGLDGAEVSYFQWDVRVADRALTDEEIAIAELWVDKCDEFPARDPSSSSLCDIQALQQYIAATLDIAYEHTNYPVSVLEAYAYSP